MKQLTMESVKQRIADLERARFGGLAISLQEERELACLHELVAVTEQRDALVVEAAQMRKIIDSVTDLDNEPQYHEQGMGCGLEDRGITDRYDAMRHGWDEAMERVYAEVIPCAEELSFPATDAYIAALRAEGVEMAISHLVEKFNGTGIGVPVMALEHLARQLRESKGEVCNG